MSEKLIISIDGDVDELKRKLKDVGVDVEKAFKPIEAQGSKIDGLKAKFSSLGQTALKAFSGINAISVGAIKAISAGIGAASAAVGGLSMAIYGATGDYEQLVGGVETLFGAGGQTLQEYAASVGKTAGEVSGEYSKLISSQNEVLRNADNAYKTAGLSANEYMSTVTSFSASLLQSLGGDTKAAAKIADMAIIDMADNANKMGTSMGDIQNAYQGFAKQNYTMLDNLKLGYGGTRGEMERLLKDAEKFSGQKYDISNLADVYEAIHVIQESMKITGTTAKEASTTLQGSFGSMKAAASNLLVAIGTGKGLDGAMKNLVASAKTFAGNLLPMVKTAMSGISSLATEIAPLISAVIPELMENVLPQLLSAGVSMLTAIVSGISAALPTLSQAGLGILSQLIASIQSVLATIYPMAGQIIQTLGQGFLMYQGAVLRIGLDILLALVQGLADALPALIPQAVKFVKTFISEVLKKLPLFAAAGKKLLTALFTGIGESIPALQPMTGFLQGLVSNFETLLPAIVGVTTAIIAFKTIMAIQSLIQGVSAGLAAFQAANKGATIAQAAMNAVMAMNPFVLITAAILGVVAAVIYLWNTNEGFRAALIQAWEAIKETFNGIASCFADIGTRIAETVSGWWTALTGAVKEIYDGIIKWFTDLWDELVGHSIVPDMIQDVVTAFTGWWDKLKAFVIAIYSGMVEWFTNIKNRISGIAKQVITSVKTGFEEKWADVVVWGTNLINIVKGWFTSIDLLQTAKDIIGDIKKGFEDAWDGVVTWFEGAWKKVTDLFKMPDWATKLFGGGKEEDQAVEAGSAEPVTAEMTNLIRVNALEPVPQAVIDSYTALNAALVLVNAEVAKLNASFGGSAESGSLLTGLSLVASFISGTMTTTFTNFLTYLSGNATTTLTNFETFLNDPFGTRIIWLSGLLYVPGGGGNTLHNSLGEVLGATESIRAAFLTLMDVWRGEFCGAVEVVKTKSGELYSALTKIERIGNGIAAAFTAAAEAIRDAIAAGNDAANISVPGKNGANGRRVPRGNTRANAWGGWTSLHGLTLVGERGPELLSTSRMMNVWRSDEIMKKIAEARDVMTGLKVPYVNVHGRQVTDQSTTNNNTNNMNFGNVYGEKYLEKMIELTVGRVLRKAVFLGAA